VPSADNAQPRYPANARRKGIEGVVVVSFEVLESGATANARIVSGPKELHEPVLETVAQWRFTPARRGSVKVRFKITRPIRFRLEDA
jgi:protein TonB